MNNKNVQVGIFITLLVIAGFVGYTVLTQPDQRSVGEKIGDAVDQLDNGVDNAARELEDRTPAERIGDEIKDATDGKAE